MTRISIFFLFLFITFSCLGQQLPINFSESIDVFSAFEGSGFAKRANPNENTDIVGQFFNDGSSEWQGFKIDLVAPVNLDVEKKISLNFYQFDPNQHTIIIKLENGTNANVEVKTTIAAGNPNSWQNNILFDFTKAKLSANNTDIDATGQYNRLVIFIDGGSKTPGTYLIDDIRNGIENDDDHENDDTGDVTYSDLVWSDEFNGSSLDTDKWHHQTFGPNGGRWFNNELQHYTDSPTNSFVKDGFLHIVAKKETKTQDGVTLDYTSARLNSKYAFTYGRVDVRAKLPEGNGTWPAIWTLGKNINETGAYWQTQGFGTTPWPTCGEIDIMEHGLHATNQVSSALHTPSSSGATINTATKMLLDVANNFHVYSMIWSPDRITFLIDDTPYYTYKPVTLNSSTWPFDLDQFILLNVAMGGFAGTIDSNFTESSMVIDYVRVYQNTNRASIDDNLGDEFTVYPNPVSDFIKIKTTKRIDNVEMYNSLGKQILFQKTPKNEINLQNLPKGLYILKIASKAKIVLKKIMVK